MRSFHADLPERTGYAGANGNVLKTLVRSPLNGKRILLIISGGIAAYKCLELIRRLRERGTGVRVVMTKAAAQFVTPLSVGALSNDKVYSELFDLNDEQEIGHIRLSREADMILVAPATANLMAKMASGLGDDLATSILLATDKPVLVAPAMNPKMWQHRATRRNVRQLKSDGISFVGPDIGEMAESGEAGEGRLASVPALLDAVSEVLAPTDGSKSQMLRGKHVLITAGPTHEPIDPVRYIANRSSGKQGFAIAKAAAEAGAKVSLIAGPTNLDDPPGVIVHHIETAQDLLRSVRAALPADIAIFAAAVADWRIAEHSSDKIKKNKNASAIPALQLVENPDILQTIAAAKNGRPELVIGFAAETQNLIEFATAKLKSKGCDWIIANDVSAGPGETSVMGADRNRVHIIDKNGVENWPQLTKHEVARRLIDKIAAHTSPKSTKKKKARAQ